MNSRQLMRWLIAALAKRPRTVEMTIGRSQLGFRTMSSNVFFGENKTPNTRPNGLIVACASGAGIGVVAIEDSSTTRLENASDCQYVRGRENISADSSAAPVDSRQRRLLS